MANTDAKFLAGGTNILDLMKEDVERPNELVDITRLKFTQIKTISEGYCPKAHSTNNERTIFQ
ncbi:MAG: FAD binding domain-containing protein [Chitinophagaceae bacterium]